MALNPSRLALGGWDQRKIREGRMVGGPTSCLDLISVSPSAFYL
jgi:hypothetical protein